MALLKYFIFVLKSDKKEKFIIKREKKFGGDVSYENYEDLEKDFISKKIHPLDLKNAVADEINFILINFRKNKKLSELHKKAYRK